MLKKLTSAPHYAGPLVTIVMDGIGISPRIEGNAVAQANAPTLKKLLAEYPNILLKAHGKAVGLPSDEDMGNSEVGHNALGSGQIYEQGASLVNQAIASGDLFLKQAWKDIASVGQEGGTVHFLGLFSDGNVHSHIKHLKALILRAKKEGTRKARIHILLDGRDVGEKSALEYVLPFESFLAETRGVDFDVCIASGGGRMFLTMDRYEADWSMVERGWHTHVLGEGKKFASAQIAIETFRGEKPGIIDQDLPAFVIEENGQPVGPILDGDAVVFFNFRGDRSIEISRAFEEKDFNVFDRKRWPRVVYAGMLEYDGDLHIPSRYLVSPPTIKHTMGEYLAHTGITQYATSETQKFGHVTYFWNGNRSGKFDERTETYFEVPSDRVSFDERPWMKAAEITDALIAAIISGKHKVIRANFANGDMVGHTGSLRAATMAVEAVDLCLARLLPVIEQAKGLAFITADHGNADEMYEWDKKSNQPAKEKSGRIKAKTSHTLNPVPFIIFDKANPTAYRFNTSEGGLANVAAMTVQLLGYQTPEMWQPSLLSFT